MFSEQIFLELQFQSLKIEILLEISKTATVLNFQYFSKTIWNTLEQKCFQICFKISRTFAAFFENQICFQISRRFSTFFENDICFEISRKFSTCLENHICFQIFRKISNFPENFKLSRKFQNFRHFLKYSKSLFFFQILWNNSCR